MWPGFEYTVYDNLKDMWQYVISHFLMKPDQNE